MEPGDLSKALRMIVLHRMMLQSYSGILNGCEGTIDASAVRQMLGILISNIDDADFVIRRILEEKQEKGAE